MPAQFLLRKTRIAEESNLREAESTPSIFFHGISMYIYTLSSIDIAEIDNNSSACRLFILIFQRSGFDRNASCCALASCFQVEHKISSLGQSVVNRLMTAIWIDGNSNIFSQRRRRSDAISRGQHWKQHPPLLTYSKKYTKHNKCFPFQMIREEITRKEISEKTPRKIAKNNPWSKDILYTLPAY